MFEIVFFRNVFAFIPLALLVWREGGPSVLRTRRLGGHLTRATFSMVAMTCGFSAMTRLPLSQMTALQFTTPLFMTALSALILKEAVGPHRWGAVLVGFAGVLVMVHPGGAPSNPAGTAFALVSAVAAAGSTVAVRQLAGVERGPAIVFYLTLAGALTGLAGSLFHWVTPDPATFAVLVCGGLIGGVAQFFITESLRRAPIGLVAPFDYTQMLWAVGLGLLLWGERPSLSTLAGAAIVSASGLYILHRELARARAARRAEAVPPV